MTCSLVLCVRIHIQLLLFFFDCFRLIWTELNVWMADGNSHPFNSDVIASETLNHYHKQSASQHITSNASKTQQQKLLLDLLSANHTSNHFFNSNDPSLNIASPTISDDDLSRLKSLIRSTIWPVDHQIRRQLWMNILTFNRVSSASSKSATHSVALTPVSPTSITVDHHFNSVPLKTNQWPNFVDTNNLCFYHLNDSTGRSSLQRILFTFALHHPDLTYCPALEPFSALLLHYFNENEVLFLINRLLQKHWLCGETRLQWEANWNVFRKLLKTYFVSWPNGKRNALTHRLLSSDSSEEIQCWCHRFTLYEQQRILSGMVLVDFALFTVSLSRTNDVVLFLTENRSNRFV